MQKVDANVGQNYNAVTLAIAGSKAEVMQKLGSMAGDNIEYFASVKQEISGGREAITERIDSMESKMDIRLNNLDNSLQSVFQSVSDGKNCWQLRCSLKMLQLPMMRFLLNCSRQFLQCLRK